MKTDISILQAIYSYGRPLIKPFITGDVYKYVRPTNSNTEDVIFNILPVDNFEIQETITNINIYAPLLLVKVNNGTQPYPPFERLGAISELVVPMFDDVFLKPERIQLDIEDAGMLQDEIGQYYYNIRLNTKTINI